jgi:hypothetical protein
MTANRVANPSYWREDLCNGYWIDERRWLDPAIATLESADMRPASSNKQVGVFSSGTRHLNAERA